jgi:hypothetical protein
MLQRQLRRITVQGQSLACLAPEDPFLYLGVTMTLTVNWRHNFDNVMAKAKEQAEALYRSLATGGQIVKLADTVLRPGIASSFSVAPFTPMQIKLLDSVMVGVYKRAYRQQPRLCAPEHGESGAVGRALGSEHVRTCGDYSSPSRLVARLGHVLQEVAASSA